MSIIQKERIENISEEYIKVNTLEINMIQSINNYKDEGYTEEIKQYLLDNIEYVTKNNKSTIIKRK